jgi:hypothetical protein
VFLNVQFAPHTGVQQVFVSVMVAGETTRSMTFDVQPPGAAGGSVEIDFATYPAGKHADLVVRLEGASGALATRSVGVELTGGCVAVDVSFAVTGGGGGGGAPGGRGGGAGATAGTGGGAAGTGGTGAAGTGGTGGAAAGGRGGGTAGTGGGTAGAGGRGGTGTGGGAAGTGGGTAGAGGRGGTGTGGGGTGGGAGAGGRGGGAGTGGAGGRGGCAATAESCFNNMDDDCDGNVDCMDPDCNTVASCVALDPAFGQLGVVVADAQGGCPPQYTVSTIINRGPVSIQCSGCGCTPPPVNCNATIYDYATYDMCMAGPAAQSSVLAFSSAFTCMNPPWHNNDPNGYVFGVGLGPLTPMYPGCTPNGAPTAGPPIWSTTARFCGTTLRGGGCGTGSVCLPAVTSTTRCAMAAGSTSCPTGTQRSDWYTSYTGDAACNACSCGQPSGASCADVKMFVGESATCTPAAASAMLAGGERFCAPPNTLLDPSVVFTGTPTRPICVPQNTSSGSLTPTGPQTVCCR